MRATSVRALSIALLAVAASCGGGDAARAGLARDEPTMAERVDSALSIDEHLSRFRAAAGPRVDSLRGGAESIEGLVERWATAISARDTAALVALTIDRAEFAWLFYPGTAMSRPPYEMPPGLLWSQLMGNSDEGLRKALQLLGGRRIRVTGVRCASPPEQEGENLLRQDCAVALRDGSTAVPPTRYFGSILERAGRFKLISHANRL